MSNHQEETCCEGVELYALDALTPEEAAEFEAHLAGCAACRGKLAELRETIGLLPLAAAPVAVPDGMRSRVLGRVLGSAEAQRAGAGAGGAEAQRAGAGAEAQRAGAGAGSAEAQRAGAGAGSAEAQRAGAGAGSAEAQRAGAGAEAQRAGAGASSAEEQRADAGAVGAEAERRVWKRGAAYWRWMSLGLSATVVGLALYASELRGDLREMERLVADAGKPPEAAKMEKMVQLQPAAEQLVSKGLASIVIDDKGTHLIVTAENLPAVQKEQAFQVWLIKGEKKVNAGTFYPHDGKGSISYTFQPQDYDMVAITLEPDAHGEQPRGTMVMMAGLKS
ncbi:anti-sigma factor domain-containing protein [Paenibacillus sp. S-38]|uniref:anti-sigma factor domain-containing protein n=1 Tax=Paenibacillus sp. S-38 TaxID=3416710 RepID=UPI003CF88AED